MSCLQWKLIMGKCVTSEWPYYRTNRRWKCIKSKQRLETNRSLWAMCQLWVGCIECERTSVELLQEPKSECEQRNGEKQACHKWSEMKWNAMVAKPTKKCAKWHGIEARWENILSVYTVHREHARTHMYISRIRLISIIQSSSQIYIICTNIMNIRMNECANEWIKDIYWNDRSLRSASPIKWVSQQMHNAMQCLGFYFVHFAQILFQHMMITHIFFSLFI